MHVALRRGAVVGVLASFLLAGSATAAVRQLSPGQRRAAASATIDWPNFGNTAESVRYSTIDQINASNVSRLGLAWSNQQGARIFGWETDPVVINGVMYYSTQLDQVRAVNAASGQLIWQYTPTVEFTQAIAGGGGGNLQSRGVTVANGKVYLLTFDDQLIALQASTGKKLWRTVIADAAAGYSESSPVTYWNGLLFASSESGDEGLRGFEAAFDANTGKQVWRWYSVPLPGQDWMPKQGDHGGGDIWMPATIDPTTGILYLGTGNASPDLDNSQRPGCNPWTDATVALDAMTGTFIWGHSEYCNDVWDYDSMPSPFIFDLQYHGRIVHAVGHANKAGLFFVYDARTGKVLSQSPHLADWSMPHLKPNHLKPVLVCPGADGGLEYSPEAYDPVRQLAYLAGLNMCMYFQLQTVSATNAHQQGLPDFGGGFFLPASGPAAKTSGFVAAVDVATGKVRWKTRLPAISIGGTLATAGGLVFTTEQDGYFDALDSSTGKIVWKAHGAWRVARRRSATRSTARSTSP